MTETSLNLIISQMPREQSFGDAQWQDFFEVLLDHGIENQGAMTPRGGLTLVATPELSAEQEDMLLGLFDKFEGEPKHYLIAVLGRLGGAKSAKCIADIVMKTSNGLDEDTMGVCAQSLWRLGGVDALNGLVYMMLIDTPEWDIGGAIVSGLAGAYAVERGDMKKGLPAAVNDVMPFSLADLEPIDVKFGCDIIQHTDWKKVLEAANFEAPEQAHAAVVRSLGVIEGAMRGRLGDKTCAADSEVWKNAKKDFLYALQPKRLESRQL